jgi:hypothetical protein
MATATPPRPPDGAAETAALKAEREALLAQGDAVTTAVRRLHARWREQRSRLLPAEAADAPGRR